MTITRFCERCERITLDGHLWCPDKDCPAEEGFPVFTYGDYLGDLKITKLVTVWRAAALYEAERDGRAVWLKVAHAAPECEDRLRREAAFLKSIRSVWRAPSRLALRPPPRPIRPLLLPPYPTPSNRPFGEISYQGETRVFSVFQPIAGSLLSDRLLEQPQVWHYEAAWVTTTIAQALQPLVSRNLTHLNLAPNLVVVGVDGDGHWRPALIDLGWLLDGKTSPESLAQAVRRSKPAYTAPELLNGKGAASPLADTYALGLILYEMLAGRPGFEPRLLRDELVSRAVTQNRAPLPVDRPELEQAGVVKIVERAIAPAERLANVLEIARALAGVYGAPPAQKRPIPPRTYLVLSLLAAAFLIAAGVAAYFLWQVG